MKALALLLALAAPAAHAAISYVGVGTACAVTATTCTPTINTGGSANTVLIAVCHSRTNTAHTCTTNCTGWTNLDNNGATGRLSVWWHRQTSATEPSNPTFGGPATESYVCRIWSFDGVIQRGNPWDNKNAGVAEAAGATYTGDAIQSWFDGDWVIYAGGSQDDNTWGPAGGSATVPSSADANFYATNTNGTDNSVYLAYGDLGTASTSTTESAPTITQATLGTDAGRSVTFFLMAEPSCTNGPCLEERALSGYSCPAVGTNPAPTVTVSATTANELLVAMVTGDTFAASGTVSWSVTGVATSWTSRANEQHASRPVRAEILSSYETGSVSGTVTATMSGCPASTQCCLHLMVLVYSNVDSDPGQANTAEGDSASASVTLNSPEASDSRLIAAGGWWNPENPNPAAGSNTTEHKFFEADGSAGGETAWGQWDDELSTAASSVTLDATTAGSFEWVMAALEIKEATGGAGPTCSLSLALMGVGCR